MASVERAASGAGGADLPISADEGTNAGTVESGSVASHHGTSPALEGLRGETGTSRAAVFGPAAHARLLDAKRNLLTYGYTDEQITDVETRHGEPGLDNLRRAHGALSTALLEKELPTLRQRLVAIASREGGLNALRAISQHQGTLLDFHNGISVKQILDLADQPDGAVLLADKANAIHDGLA